MRETLPSDFLLGALDYESLPGDLLDLDDDELGRVERRKAHQDVHDALVDAGLRIVLRVALDEVGLLRRGSLECALQEQSLHEGADVEPDLAPERLVVGLEDHPLRAVVQAGLEEKRQPPDRNVLPLRARLIVAGESARSPHHVAIDLELAQAVDGLRVQVAVLKIGQHVLQSAYAGQASVIPAGAFHTPRLASVAA